MNTKQQNCSTVIAPSNMRTKIFDSDMLKGTDKKTILAAILKSGKPFTIIHGPAGCGKTTIAVKQFGGNFVESLTCVKKADSFVVLSGASKTKSGQPSSALADMVKRAEKVVFIIVGNFEIARRRRNRIECGTIDKRETGQLTATFNAPLNDFYFLSVLKKLSKKTEIFKG